MTEAPEHIPLWRESRFSSREMRSHEGPSRSNPLGRWAVEDTQPTEAGDSWLQSAWRSATNPQGRRMSTHGQGHGPVSKRTQNKAVPAVLYFQDLTKKYSLPFLLTCFSKYSHYLRVIISKSDFQNKTKQNTLQTAILAQQYFITKTYQSVFEVTPTTVVGRNRGTIIRKSSNRNSILKLLKKEKS